jgi:Tfp pilus assembly protein PilO
MSDFKRKQILIGMPMIFIIFLLLVILPVNGKNIRHLQEIYRIKRLSQSPDSLAGIIEELQRENRKLQQNIFSLEVEFPTSGNLSGIYSRLGELAVKNNVSISRITPRKIIPDSILPHLPVGIEIEARFSEILIYMNALEGGCPFIHIRECHIENTPGKITLFSRIVLDICLKRENHE